MRKSYKIMKSLLLHNLHPERWFIWTLAILFVVGVGLIGYIQYVNYDLDTANILLLAAA